MIAREHSPKVLIPNSSRDAAKLAELERTLKKGPSIITPNFARSVRRMINQRRPLVLDYEKGVRRDLERADCTVLFVPEFVDYDALISAVISWSYLFNEVYIVLGSDHLFDLAPYELAHAIRDRSYHRVAPFLTACIDPRNATLTRKDVQKLLDEAVTGYKLSATVFKFIEKWAPAVQDVSSVVEKAGRFAAHYTTEFAKKLLRQFPFNRQNSVKYWRAFGEERAEILYKRDVRQVEAALCA